MNIKTVITLTAALFFLSATAVQAQGIYSTKKDNPIKTQVEKGRQPTLYAPPPPPGGDPNSPGGADQPSPIADGVFFLTVLAGSYIMAKNRKTRKK